MLRLCTGSCYTAAQIGIQIHPLALWLGYYHFEEDRSFQMEKNMGRAQEDKREEGKQQGMEGS